MADYQPELGHALIDGGVDMIYGHHPHGVHGIELCRGAAIFYSMGTFLAQQLCEDAGFRPPPVRATMSRAGLIVVLDIETGRLRGATVHHTTLGPIHTRVVTDHESFILGDTREPEYD